MRVLLSKVAMPTKEKRYSWGKTQTNNFKNLTIPEIVRIFLIVASADAQWHRELRRGICK